MKDESPDDRTLVRAALERAARDPEPDMSRLLDAVPGLLAEAGRRRLFRRETPLTAVVPLAWKLIPRLAAAAVILVLASTVMVLRDSGGTDRDRQDLDRLLLVGTDAAGVEDLLLEDILAQENGNG